MPIRRPRGPSPQQIRRRRVVGAAVRSCSPSAPRSSRWRSRCRTSTSSADRRRRCRRRRSRSASSSRRASRARRWPSASRAVAKIAAAQAAPSRSRSTRAPYVARDATRDDPVLHAARAGEGRGIPLPGDVRLPREDDVEAARRASSSRRSARTGTQVEPRRTRRSKNLTPYDVLIIASMVEKETLAPDERPHDRRGHLQPAAPAHAARDRRHPAVRAAHPADAVDPRSRSSRATTRTTRASTPGLPPTPIANPGLASIQAAAHPAKVDYLYFVRKPDKVHHFFTASDTAFAQYECAHGYGC